MLEELNRLVSLPVVEQITNLIHYFGNADAVSKDSPAYATYIQLVENILEDTSIESKAKLSFFEEMNKWGDPRLNIPNDEKYWTKVSVSGGDLGVGRHLVSIKEWLHFLEGEYENDEHWSEAGMFWRMKRKTSWQELADSPDSARYVWDNHPVVGVSWFEAEAYANCHNARLMAFFEREQIVRGPEKRRYPWGGSFKLGYANTEEEDLAKTSPVGMYRFDQTPEGVFDLAGNVAEWMVDEVDQQRVVHPGCWAKDSISTWSKASEVVSPNARLAFLGFRLVRDL
jgi:formylglycine-generating enzyme required for sulfatase activity